MEFPSLSQRLKERKKANKEVVQSSDESEPEEDLPSGAVLLHRLHDRKVILGADGTVVKCGKRVVLGEADALQIAAKAGLPVPRVLEANKTAEGQVRIRMEYVPGQSLDKLWPSMSVQERQDIAKQLGEIVKKMRSIDASKGFIGACDGSEIRDTRLYFTYHAPPCQDEAAFNEFLLSALYEQTPPLLREAFSRRLRDDRRIVFSHCDLAPRNIMVLDGQIQALLDWEDSGWYPEYWEYVKFLLRPADKDWKHYANEIFSDLYHDELVDLIAISKWQNS